MRGFCHAAVAVVCVLLAACSSKGVCESPYAQSPQFKGCGFQNPVNPDALPSASGWKIWSRFLFGTKVGTVPVDAIPVQALSTAQLDALDVSANHVVRLGHSSHLLKLLGKFWLIDPVFGERVSPFSFMGPKRFHAPPLTLEQLPPIEGLILSHDHYDHLDVPTIHYLAQRVQRYFVPLGVKARLVEMGGACGAHRGVGLVAESQGRCGAHHVHPVAAFLGPHAERPQRHTLVVLGHPEW